VTGNFVSDHVALGRRISGSVVFDPEGAIASLSGPQALQIGYQLCFALPGPVEGPEVVITSPLRSVERPLKEIVSRYALDETLH
jgi:hypothetical protein